MNIAWDLSLAGYAPANSVISAASASGASNSTRWPAPGTISSRAYGSTTHWSAICNANSLANCDYIEVGAVLNIPTLAQTDTQRPVATATPEPTADAMTPQPTAEAMTPDRRR